LPDGRKVFATLETWDGGKEPGRTFELTFSIDRKSIQPIGTIMNMRSFFAWRWRFVCSPPAAVLWVALTCSCLAFCGEINDAAQVGNLDDVKTLLKDHPDLVFNKDTNRGWTPLHWAAEKGYKDLAEFLLANQAEVDATTYNGQTPLHMAANRGYHDMVELLLEHNAKINAKDNDGETPLHLAAVGGHKDVTELLLANHAEGSAQDKSPGLIIIGLSLVVILLVLYIRNLGKRRKWNKTAMGALMIPLCFGSFIGAIGTVAYIFIYSSEANRVREDTVFNTFDQAIEVARNCKLESLRDQLNYPPHSLVVYSFDSHHGGRYQLACARNWTATKKEQVRLVVLVSRNGPIKVIGHYEQSGIAAFEGKWGVFFIDLDLRQIVAKSELTERDPPRIPNFSGQSAIQEPNEAEVVSEIQKTVHFAE
jgi:hypothetical protein